jgi:hypothetical protein
VRFRDRNQQPPLQLPERTEDRARYPRETFEVRFVNDNGFGIDTASGMVNYDRIDDPDTMIALRLSDAQLDTLYEEALKNRLFEMEEPLPLGTRWAGAEHWGGMLTVKSGALERSFRWDVWNPTANWTDGHKRINSYVGTLERMVVTSPVYRAMPRPKGMYID